MGLLWVVCLISLFAAPVFGAPRPNFVIILTDDLGYGDLGCFGSAQIRTPNLDRMAAEGIRLTEFYAAPTCTPARAMLLTGRYPIRSGLTRALHPGEDFGMPESEITLAEALRELGYASALIGKWHLGDKSPYRPLRHGFDHYYGLLYSHDMTLLPPNLRRLQLFLGDEPVEWPVDVDTLTQRYTEQAKTFIEQNKDRPFFLYLAHSMPHVPVRASKAFRHKSPGGIYGDAVEEIDWGLGELLVTIRQHGLEQNTLVIFTSDNGPAIVKSSRGGSTGSLRGGKHTTWEGGVRVPFVARWPGRIPGGRVEPGIASLMDLYPTVIELAGGEIPSDRPIDGKSMNKMLEGESDSPGSTFIYYRDDKINAIRSGKWKLHFFKVRLGAIPLLDRTTKCDPPELYNLARDPSERTNVARDRPEVVARLTATANEFAKKVVPGKPPPRLWLSR